MSLNKKATLASARIPLRAKAFFSGTVMTSASMSHSQAGSMKYRLLRPREVVIVVQENAVVMKELCRCEEKEKEKVTVASGTMGPLRGEFSSSE